MVWGTMCRDNLHRPSIIDYTGTLWFSKNKFHRLDGPAIERPDGGVEYYINGVFYNKSQWKKYHGM